MISKTAEIRPPIEERQDKRQELLDAAARIYGNRPVIVHVMEEDPEHNCFHPKYLLFSNRKCVAYFSSVEKMSFRIIPHSAHMHINMENGSLKLGVERGSEEFMKGVKDAVFGILSWYKYPVDVETPEGIALQEILSDDRVFQSLDDLKALVREKNIGRVINELYMEQPDTDGFGRIHAELSEVVNVIFALYSLVKQEK